MPALRDVFEKLLHEGEINPFAAWAFGGSFTSLPNTMDFMEAWNALHSDILHLVPTGGLLEDAEKMVKLWREWQSG